MDLTLVMSMLILACIIVLGKYISNSLKTMDIQAKKYNEFIYTEARRASRLSLQCRLELENLTLNSNKQYNEMYSKQTEILSLLKSISGDVDDFDISTMEDKESKAKDILQKVKIRQAYISDAIERLEKML